MKALLLLMLIPVTLYGQMEQKSTILPGMPTKLPAFQRDSVRVKWSTLMSIAREYGVDTNFTITPSASNKTGKIKIPEEVTLRMSLAQFEEWMKQVAFNEKKAKIIQQLYLKDFQDVKTGREYVALKRAYLKKYPEYLKDEPMFQESILQMQEKSADSMILNNKYGNQKKSN